MARIRVVDGGDKGLSSSFYEMLHRASEVEELFGTT
jgi:hypothetical protein